MKLQVSNKKTCTRRVGLTQIDSTKKTVGLDRRAVLQVLLLLVRCWTARGGRDFAFKPQRVVQNFKEALKRVTYTKPNYVGRVKEVWKWKQLSGQDARFKRI